MDYLDKDLRCMLQARKNCVWDKNIGEDMDGALEKRPGTKKHHFKSCPGPVLSRTEEGINVCAV